jgi:hypothetical protein
MLNNRTFKWKRISSLDISFGASIDKFISLLNGFDGMNIFDLEGPGSTEELLELLNKRELQGLCSKYRVDFKGKNVSDIRDNLIKFTSTQPLITFNNIISFAKDGLNSLISDVTGSLVKLNSKCRDLFHRLFVIYFRTSKWPTDSKFMIQSVRSNLKETAPGKLFIVPFTVIRFGLFWSSRNDCLNYIKILKLEFEIMESSENNRKSWLDIVKETIPLYNEWVKKCSDGDIHFTGIPWLQKYTSGKVIY